MNIFLIMRVKSYLLMQSGFLLCQADNMYKNNVE